MAIRWCGIAAITGASSDRADHRRHLRRHVRAGACRRSPRRHGPKVVHFTATSAVHNSGGASFAGTFQSRRLGSGTVRYTGKPAGDASVTTWLARLRSGTLKGTARTTLTPGATDMDPATIDGAGKITGGTRSFDGVEGNFVVSGQSNPDGTLTLPLDGELEFAVG
jgi:hypothetical protein